MNHFDEDVPPGVDFLSEKAARKWAREAEEKLPSRMNFFAAFVTALTKFDPEPGNVLELGSGPGFLAEYVLSRCPFIQQYTLLDFSEPMLSMARTRLRLFEDRVSFLQVDFKQQGWADKVSESYDCIVSIQAVHELRHKRHGVEFYKKCKTLLNRGGLMLICDRLPQDDSDRDRALFMAEDEQLRALSRAGFSDPEVLLRTAERVACRAFKGR